MINKLVELPDGRQLDSHEFKESLIDFSNKQITFITVSYLAEDTSQVENLKCVKGFETWDPELSSYESAQAAIQELELTLYDKLEKPEVVKTLEELRQDKSNEIDSQCREKIISGFTSEALGSLYVYPSKITDQQNLTASVLASYDPDNAVDWLTPFWCADTDEVWAYRPHNPSQIREVGRDGKSSITGYQYHNEQLQALIKLATSKEELDLITWESIT